MRILDSVRGYLRARPAAEQGAACPHRAKRRLERVFTALMGAKPNARSDRRVTLSYDQDSVPGVETLRLSCDALGIRLTVMASSGGRRQEVDCLTHRGRREKVLIVTDHVCSPLGAAAAERTLEALECLAGDLLGGEGLEASGARARSPAREGVPRDAVPDVRGGRLAHGGLDPAGH